MAKKKVMTKKVGASAALGLALMPLGAAAANAEPVAIVGQEQHNVGALDDSGFWNRFQLSDGTFAFCNGDPQNPGALNDFVYDNANITEVNGAFTALGGTAWNDQQAHAAAYILSTQGAASSSPAAVQYAVMSLASPYYPGSAVGLSQDLIDAGEAMKAEALANAENFVNFNLGEVGVSIDSVSRTGVVTTNAPAGAYDVTLTLEGATFADGSTSMTGRATDFPKSVDVKVAGDAASGAVKAVFSSNNVPSTSFQIMTQPDWQDLFIAGKLKSASAEGVGEYNTPAPEPTPTPEQPKPEPTPTPTPTPEESTPAPTPTPTPTPEEKKTTPPSVSTVASDDVELVDGKAELFDNLTVEGDVPEGAYVTVALYKLGNSTNQEEVLASNPKCENPVAVTEKMPINKAGKYVTDKVTVTEPGTYGFVETLFDKDGNVLDKGLCGEVSETVVVTAPAPETTPVSVSTVASDDVELVDGKAELFDNLKVEGDVPEGAYATVALYKLSDSTNQEEVLSGEVKCENPVGVTKRMDIPAAGNYQTEKVTVTEPGTYGFVETLFDKDGNVLDKGLCGEVAETVVVTEPDVPAEEQSVPETPVETPAPETPAPETPAPVVEKIVTPAPVVQEKVVREVVAHTAAGAVQEAKDVNKLAVAGGAAMILTALAGATAFVVNRRK